MYINFSEKFSAALIYLIVQPDPVFTVFSIGLYEPGTGIYL